MKCPFCNEEMEKGYVDSSDIFRQLEWYPAKQEPGIFVSTKRNIKLTSGTNGSVIMHYCVACRKFVIDQDDLNA